MELFLAIGKRSEFRLVEDSLNQFIIIIIIIIIIMTDNPKAMVPKSGGVSGPNTEQGAQPAENVRKQTNKNRKPGMSASTCRVHWTTAAHAHATGKRKI